MKGNIILSVLFSVAVEIKYMIFCGPIGCSFQDDCDLGIFPVPHTNVGV